MSTDYRIQDSIERAAESVGLSWPLHSFVTANPLSGFEEKPFHEGVKEGERLFGGRGYPRHEVFRKAWSSGEIDSDILMNKLSEHGYEEDPEVLLDRMKDEERRINGDKNDSTTEDEVDKLLTKWLAAFLDEGMAEWSMPNRKRGFYAAFHEMARYDGNIPDGIKEHPKDSVEAIRRVVSDYPEEDWEGIFEYHLTSLPGWTSFIKQRAQNGGAWQSKHPITLTGYLAARLVLSDVMDAKIDGYLQVEPESEGTPLQEVWLSAWEETYRDELVGGIKESGKDGGDESEDSRPAAQLVFCIDTRSEIIRRHIESTGEYETHGYAGFFGVPMRYEGHGSEVSVDACPPILSPEHRVEDRPNELGEKLEKYDRWSSLVDAGQSVIKSLKTNAATAFNFVETAGSGYGVALATRTLFPSSVYDFVDTVDSRVPGEHEFCEPKLDHESSEDGDLPLGMTLDEKVEYAANAFEMMGWEEFARIAVFVGHASQTANNPFDSSLDCGACAGNPGGPSARVLAKICNDGEVRKALRDRGIDIPDDTVFVAGEHNTTTDEVTLFTSNVPRSHEEDIENLRRDLETAREGATAERMGLDKEDPSARETERRAADWAETRPEWGLAGNAAFVIGRRELTSDLDLDGRSFLHSYDWETDPDGDALEGILTGPMVVTQWINNQYYFATVDNSVYGSGSKITQNPVGNIGVYQGNGGDLMTGLPLQSLKIEDDEPYHQPLRLTTVIHAPVERVTEILREHENLTTLLDNDWISLTVIDPEKENEVFHYQNGLEWESDTSQKPQVVKTKIQTDH